MSEQVRSITVKVVVDTNKDTYTLDVDVFEDEIDFGAVGGYVQEWLEDVTR